MVFSSLIFLTRFLPVFFAVYLLTPAARRNLVLFLAAGTLAGETFYLLRYGAGGRTKETVVFLFCTAALLVCTVLWRLVISRLRWS